jgi:aspartate/tyrosine/aromatic aminotransferase
MSYFQSCPQAVPDPLFHLVSLFKEDSNPLKVNLSVGVYRDDNGQPFVFEAVRQAEERIHEKKLDKEYLSLDGHSEFLQSLMTFAFGKDLMISEGSRMHAMQTVAGTGALRLGADFLHKFGAKQTIYLSNPTWANHEPLMREAGLEIGTYRYYDRKSASLDFEGMCADILKMPSGSFILLHASCHNPTGIDLTLEQWMHLSRLIKEQNLIPFFDQAYQGLGVDEESDAFGVRCFLNDGHEIFVAYSCSKNFGLYGERIGMLVYAAENADIKAKVKSQLNILSRKMISTCPCNGARIVSEVLNTPELFVLWKKELSEVRERIYSMRKNFFKRLSIISEDVAEEQVLLGNGLFTLLSMPAEQIQSLRDVESIYIPKSGRINIAGLNTHNMDTVIAAFERT